MTAASSPTGWKPIPLPLKVLPFVMALWALGSVANLPNLTQNGVPFFGLTVGGLGAALIALFFDFLGPLVFVVALWTRKPWAPKWAALYIGLFVLNGIVTLITSAGTYGVPQILAPCVISLAILGVIWWKRGYFAASS